MKILLAGPGTGKTTKIKKLIASEFSSAEKIQVISFTNATVNDLTESFGSNSKIKCSTLHSFAFGLNHHPELHIMMKLESDIILTLSKKLEIEFSTLCEQLQCITFEGMIKSCVAFIKANPAYSEEKIGKLDLLVIDEFQDFNPDEQQLVKLTSTLSGETIIMGDDDQSIYGFKDADPEGIMELYNNPGIEKIQHDNICYRCPDTIVDYCNELLKKNTKRIKKDWKKNSKDGKLIIQQLLTQNLCDDYILSIISAIKDYDNNASILILSPIRVAVETLKKRLTEKGTEFVDCWSTDWDKEILCKIWWLNAIYGKNKLVFLVFLLKHYKNLSKAKLLDLIKSSFQEGTKEMDIIHKILQLKLLPELFATYIQSPPPIQEFFQMHQDFGFLQEYINLEDIINSMKDLASKANVKKEFEKGKINLMSIHKSKGLQSEYVIINGLVSGILPNETRGLDTIEAQRRLLFVGMTRALKELYLVSTVEWEGGILKRNNADIKQFQFVPWKRKYHGKTSKFIEEIIV